MLLTIASAVKRKCSPNRAEGSGVSLNNDMVQAEFMAFAYGTPKTVKEDSIMNDQ